MNINEFPNRLRELRKEKKVTVEKISEYLEISPSHYYGLEKKEKRLNEDLLIKISDFYGVSIDYILCRTDGRNNVILEGDTLPEELRGYVDAISIAKKGDITPEGLKEIIEAAKRIRGIK